MKCRRTVCFKHLQCITISLAIILSLAQRPAVQIRVRCLVSSDFTISALLLLTSLHSGCLRTGVQSSCCYLLLSNVNKPVSLTVRVIMCQIIHVGRYFTNRSKVVVQ